jgi:DNA polymerase-3 subunit delta
MPVILLEGTEDFSKQAAMNEIRTALALTMHDDPNIITFDAEALTFEELMMASSTVPFLAQARLTCVYGLLGKMYGKGTGNTLTGRRRPRSSSRGAWDPEQVWAYLRDDLPASTTVILVEDAPPHAKLLEEIASFVQIRSFYPLSRSDLQSWIKQCVLHKGGEIEPPAVARLAEIYKGRPTSSRQDDGAILSLRQLDQEIEKLCLYVAVARPISVDDVVAFIETEPEVNIFRFVDAVYDGKLVIACRLLENLLAGGKDPWYIYNMLAREARLLVGAHHMVIASASTQDIRLVLGLSPRAPLDSLLNRARKMSKETLHRNYDLLVAADMVRKGSTVFTDSMVVQQLTEDLCVNAGAIS